MIHSYISQAILSLRPGAQITIDNDDSTKITIHDDTVLPSDDELLVECEKYAAKLAIVNEIELLESQITPRRMRDHALGTGGDWLEDQEALIAVEREKL